MGTTHFSGPVDSAEGFSVDGTVVIDGDGNIDAPVTTVSPLTLTKTDDGATGAIFNGIHVSASPESEDIVAIYRGTGKNDAGEDVIYGDMFVLIDDVTDGAELGGVIFRAMAAGTLTEVGAFIHDGTNATLELGDGTNAAILTNPDAALTISTGAGNGDITLTPHGDGATVINGALVAGETTTSSGAGAVGITGSIHEITTTGTGDALTLADGTEGQRLTVAYVAEAAGGDTAVVTPTNLAGGTTVTFNNIGDLGTFTFTAGTWFYGGSAVLA